MKRIICLVLSLLILVLFVSCSSFKQIEDTNGSEDYSVCSITDEHIKK